RLLRVCENFLTPGSIAGSRPEPPATQLPFWLRSFHLTLSTPVRYSLRSWLWGMSEGRTVQMNRIVDPQKIESGRWVLRIVKVVACALLLAGLAPRVHADGGICMLAAVNVANPDEVGRFPISRGPVPPVSVSRRAATPPASPRST